MDVLSLIAGRWVGGEGAEFADTNPARPSEVVARGRFTSVPEVERAVAAARAAAPGWAATPHHARAAVLVANPLRLSATPPAYHRPPPALGQDDAWVREILGP
ncbi:aldehyde dehydrogenase family protein [Nonomuraea sp. KM90]|uniref:aldehyde dehydrogenase family protein n=1 Tax=Nonomuraea sp. KM90 TaxID=3457428 RepID=UPI003FCC66EB